jgi:hypothetical protein
VAVDGKTLRGARGAGSDGRPGAPADSDGPHQPRGAGPTPGRRRARGSPGRSAAAGRARPCRRGRHRRRAPHPRRHRRVPGRRQARPLLVSGQGQPAPPAGPRAAPALAACPGRRPHP